MGQRRWMRGIVILASSEYHFIRVHENLVQHLSNNTSIILALKCFEKILSYLFIHPPQISLVQ